MRMCATSSNDKLAARLKQMKERVAVANLLALDGETVDTLKPMVDSKPGSPKSAKQMSEKALCEEFGIPSLKPFQRDVLTHLGVLDVPLPPPTRAGSVSNGRREILGVQPTGAGKSLCFQGAAAVLEGTTIVVTPLLSLMFDQVNSLSTSSIRVATLNSMQTAAERAAVMRMLSAGEVDLLYTSPEQLDKNKALVRTLQSLEVPLFAVDEAHCIR